MAWFKPKKKPEVTAALRRQALEVTAIELGLSPTPEHPNVWGALMDASVGNGYYTLVAFGEGTTSLYFGTQSGIIGAGQHEEIRTASNAFLEVAESLSSGFTPAENEDLPPRGSVRFWLHTYSGLRVLEAPESALLDQAHQLAPLFWSAQKVIEAIRRTAETMQELKDHPLPK